LKGPPKSVKLLIAMSAHILVVDDSAFARRTLRRILEERGYGVEEARNGPEAIEKYRSKRADVVFLDVVMDGINGLEVLQRLREFDAHARVVLATADVQTCTRDEALSGGASAVINKPFEAAQVAAVVTQALQAGPP
jgi:two-component system chemotaxis response regulator CheY